MQDNNSTSFVHHNNKKLRKDEHGDQTSLRAIQAIVHSSTSSGERPGQSPDLPPANLWGDGEGRVGGTAQMEARYRGEQGLETRDEKVISIVVRGMRQLSYWLLVLNSKLLGSQV